MPKRIKGSKTPKLPKTELTPRPCEVCAQPFLPRMKQQLICGEPNCKKEKQRRFARESLARKAAHIPGLPWATAEACALIAQAMNHPTARKQRGFMIVRTEGYRHALAIQLAETAGESGRPVSITIQPERIVVIGRLTREVIGRLTRERWMLRAASTPSPNRTQEAR